jgi:hypothetical protein
MVQTIRIFIVLSLFGIINMFYFLLLTRNYASGKIGPCTMNIYLNALTVFIENNGKLQFSESVSNECIGKTSKNANTMIRKSISKKIRQCYIENARQVDRLPLDREIMTLFTSWTANSSRFHVHNNTITNWSTLMPRVNLVLFTNDSSLSSYVKDRGWTSYPIIRHAAGGSPILKSMFEKVLKNFNSTFYGYANSDNLFDSSLLETLTTIYNEFGNKTPVFISGRRTNVDFLSMKEAISYGNIRNAVKTRGILFGTDAEDYFITNKLFDWSIVPDLAIGRRAYDNWLVLHARAVGAITIDTSRTLLAVHQTTKTGNFEGHGHTDPHYNDNLLLKLKLDRNYQEGHTTCMEYETFHSLCDKTEVSKRVEIPGDCKKISFFKKISDLLK